MNKKLTKGDVILFKAEDDWLSRAIAWFTQSETLPVENMFITPGDLAYPATNLEKRRELFVKKDLMLLFHLLTGKFINKFNCFTYQHHNVPFSRPSGSISL